jgi:Ca-activated chloride channel family protein
MVHIRHPRPARLIAAVAGVLLALSACSGGTGTNSGASSGVAGGSANGAPNANPALGLSLADSSGEVDPARQPLSTFGLDIDTASYTFARRQILDGHRPDPTTVRPEEFINAFQQDYPQPSGSGFTVGLDGSRMPDSNDAPSDTRLLRVGLQTRADTPANRPDAALTFVIDVSGSMGEPGKLDLVKDALHYLIGQLRQTDSVGIVAFSYQAEVIQPMTPVGSRSRLHEAVDRLAIEGSTNLEAGLLAGYQVARDGFVPGATNRVILLSDGLPNVGDTSAQAILSKIREEAGQQITLLGVGVGSDYGDAFMEQLADQGNGFVVYVSTQAQARQLFVTQLPATLTLQARGAKAQVTFLPSAVVSYRLLGYEDRALDPSQFRDDNANGGVVGPGRSVTALYLVRLRSGVEANALVAEAEVRWQDPITGEARETGGSVNADDLQAEFASTSPRLQVCYAAAFFAEVLRHDATADQVNLTDLQAIAAGAAASTEDPQVRDLADIIGRAIELG